MGTRAWLWGASLWLGGMLVGLAAQPPEPPTDPGVRWLSRNRESLQEFVHAIRASELRHDFERAVALWEWHLATTHAAHEWACTLWVSNAVLRQQGGEPQARGAYLQRLSEAQGQYLQALSQAYGAWMRAQSSALERSQKDWNEGWGELQRSLNRNFQRLQQEVQQLAEAPAPMGLGWPEGLSSFSPDPMEKTCREQLEAALSAFQSNLEKVTEAWRKEVLAVLPAGANPEEAERRLRQANRQWLLLANDALEDLRSAGRQALLRYQLPQGRTVAWARSSW